MINPSLKSLRRGRSSSRCERGIVFPLVAIAIVGAGCHAALGQEFQTFDNLALTTAGGWTGSGNTVGGNNYGFSNTNFTGAAAGEAGGAILSRSNGITYFADTTIGVFTQQSDLSATGRITLQNTTGWDGGFELGWFNSSETDGLGAGPGVGGPAEFIGARLADTGARIQARSGGSAGAFVSNVQTAEDYLFEMVYDADGSGPGLGRLEVELIRASDNVSLGTSVLTNIPAAAPTFNLDAFGLLTLDFNNNLNPIQVFVDNLQYSSNAPATVIPEPSTWASYLIVGMVLACYAARRSWKSSKVHPC